MKQLNQIWNMSRLENGDYKFMYTDYILFLLIITALTIDWVQGQLIKMCDFCYVSTQKQLGVSQLNPTSTPLHSHRDKGQHTVDVKMYCGSFAHGHCWIACHTGEVGATVRVDWCDGQVAPGCDPFPVWQHLLFNKERRRKVVECEEGGRQSKIKDEQRKKKRWRKEEWHKRIINGSKMNQV